jgi:hypothetical protein
VVVSGGARCRVGVVFVDFELVVERLQYTVCRHSEGQVLIDWGLYVPTIK